LVARRGSSKPAPIVGGPIPEQILWQWQSGSLFTTNRYRLTNLAFYAVEGGVRKDTSNIPLSRVQAVRVERSIWQGLVSRRGTVIVVLRDWDEDTFELYNVPEPDGVAGLFTRAISGIQLRQ